jgi:hypothetical protein
MGPGNVVAFEGNHRRSPLRKSENLGRTPPLLPQQYWNQRELSRGKGAAERRFLPVLARILAGPPHLKYHHALTQQDS